MGKVFKKCVIFLFMKTVVMPDCIIGVWYKQGIIIHGPGVSIWSKIRIKLNLNKTG